MKVNGIDLDWHFENGEDINISGKKLYSFLHKNCPYNNETPGFAYIPMIPIGHGVKDDIRKLSKQLMVGVSKYISHNVLDTCVIAQFMRTNGFIKFDRIRLEDLANFYGLRYIAHTSRNDALMSLEIYKRMTYEMAQRKL